MLRIFSHLNISISRWWVETAPPFSLMISGVGGTPFSCQGCCRHNLTGCQVGSIPDLSLETALVCSLDFVSEHSPRQGPRLLHQLVVGGDDSSLLLDDLWRVRISGAGLEIWWENVLSCPHIYLLPLLQLTWREYETLLCSTLIYLKSEIKTSLIL